MLSSVGHGNRYVRRLKVTTYKNEKMTEEEQLKRDEQAEQSHGDWHNRYNLDVPDFCRPSSGLLLPFSFARDEIVEEEESISMSQRLEHS
jgi:hypothetical protein